MCIRDRNCIYQSCDLCCPYPAPSEIDPFTNGSACLTAISIRKILRPFTSARRHTKSLAFMLASAFSGYLTISFSEQCIEAAHIHFHLIRTGVIHISELVAIPEDPFCLPWLYSIFKLFGKSFGVSSYFKCLI